MIYIFSIIFTLAILVLFIINLLIKKYPNKLINLGIFFSLLLLVVCFSINVIAVIKSYKIVGNTGDKGIQGQQGISGSKGYCNNKCGQKVCYINVVDKANNYFKIKLKNNKETIENKWFINLINHICNSEGYFDILTKEHKKKPTEQKLIKYITSIIYKWIDLILEVHKKDGEGIFFLKSKNMDKNFLNKSLLKEIEKYDIYRWTLPNKLKRKKIIVKSNNLDIPKVDQSQLNMIKSNNYKEVYNARTKNDVWDNENCPYNQMGIKNDNPNELEKCVFIDKTSYKKGYKNTWKNTEYKKPQELSIYNVESYKNNKGQQFYPVGSVWRGKNTKERPKYSFNSPESSSFCGDGHGLGKDQQFNNEGPEKETILVSGDVEDPKAYKKVWDSKKKCPECQGSHTQIFRPIPKKGYKCLGDVAIKWFDDTTENGKINQERALNDLNIKCVPQKCVRKVNLGPKIYDNKNMTYNKYNNYKDYISKNASKTNNQLPMSLWEAGSSNIGEEINNRYGINLEDNGGYNLFRASQSYNEKDKDIKHTYLIKKECTLPARGKNPKNIKLDVNQEVSMNEERYNTSKYFGQKPQQAILTNIYDKIDDGNIGGPFNERKKLYLIDDNTKRKLNEPDTFHLKTFNEEKNDFSSCLEVDSNLSDEKIQDHKVSVKPYCEKNNNLNKWVVNYDDNENNLVNSTNVSIRPKEKSDLCLVNYYNKHGKNKNKLVKCKDNNIWKYSTLLPTELPNKII